MFTKIRQDLGRVRKRTDYGYTVVARTKSLSYSRMNLSAFQRLARLGEKVGVDLWNYETPDGRSIKKAQDFLAPYLRREKEWEYPQLKSNGPRSQPPRGEDAGGRPSRQGPRRQRR